LSEDLMRIAAKSVVIGRTKIRDILPKSVLIISVAIPSRLKSSLKLASEE
jgi:hypothetical protein